MPWTPAAGPEELPVIEAMKTHRFETEGFARTYWDFYFGFGVIISAFLLVQAVVLWQLGSLARTGAAQVRPIVASFLVAFVVNAIGSFYLYLHGDVRKASGTKVGDRVRVEVGFDAKYRNGPQHPVPSWFRSALRKDSRAMKNWDALISSRKKEILRYFARLKSPEARERNLERALHVLSGRKGRFMARAWDQGA